MKIRIIGYAGSGKTSLTLSLQEKYLIQGISLDDFLKIKDKNQRMTSLNARLETLDAWIVEGVQVSPWTNKSFHDADLIVVLDYPLYITQFRVVKRTCSQVFDKNRDLNQKKRPLNECLNYLNGTINLEKDSPASKETYIIKTQKS